MRRFDIYRVEFQFGQETDKRPVILLSPQWYIDEQKRDNVIVAPLSSAIDLMEQCSHFYISPEHEDYPDTGLSKPSYVAMDHITFVPRSMLNRKIGRLCDSLGNQLIEKLRGFLSV